MKHDILANAPTSYIHLEVQVYPFPVEVTDTNTYSGQSIPLPLDLMFNEYFQLGTRIKKHYGSPGVLLCLVSGRFIPPIHRKNLYSLQYSMLPARRFGIGELWLQLNEVDKAAPKEGVHQNGSWRIPMGMANDSAGGKNHALNGIARRRKR